MRGALSPRPRQRTRARRGEHTRGGNLRLGPRVTTLVIEPRCFIIPHPRCSVVLYLLHVGKFGGWCVAPFFGNRFWGSGGPYFFSTEARGT